ncbi:MAG: D-2-hydroxyacid dehydrogenase [Roseobacter sp.]
MIEAPRIILHNSDTREISARLQAAHPDAHIKSCHTYDALPSLIDNFRPDVVYSVRFAGSQGFPRDALFGVHGPKWLANGGAGTDHYGSWNPNRTTVTNAAGVAADMMAEYVLGGFLHFTLDVTGLQQDQQNRVWQARTVVPLAGKTLLIVGLGNTGQALALRAKAFGMTVVGTRSRAQPMPNVDEVHNADTLQKLLPRADFIAVCVPLIAATRGLIGLAEIAAMKTGVYFADVSRGGVVDQNALCDALRSGHIGGGALDVFEKEPLPPESPLWGLPNVILSPHCSSVYAGWEDASFDLFLKNLTRWREGSALINVVDPGRGY